MRLAIIYNVFTIYKLGEGGVQQIRMKSGLLLLNIGSHGGKLGRRHHDPCL
jgi:hypothetical protein